MASKLTGSLAAMLMVLATWIGWDAFQALVLDNCDPKFGCSGGVLFVAFYSGIAAVFTAIAFMITAYLPGLVKSEAGKRYHVGVGVSGGFMVSLILVSVPHWGLEIMGMVVGWFVLNVATFVFVFFVSKRS